ncbi:MAG: cytochrome c oxidase subunit 4 [Candidatus Eremiobacteraeota bacterium]|nr:cytochrome c oxidase subunit 4 [Candidatus Eremiobacteraeota bacterium]
MKTAVRLFASSMTFAIVIAAVYGITTRDVVGVIFLGAMAVALIVVAVFILVGEREANLAGDDENLSPADVVGEEMGVFSLESYWPILAAAGTAVFLVGLVFIPGLSMTFVIVGAALIAWTLRFLVREST